MTNRPIILDDPTGHCPGRKPGQKCATNPKATNLPDWWNDEDEKEHIYIEGYGYFDTGHIRRGWKTGKYLMGLNLGENGGDFPMVSSDFIVKYSVSEKVTKDQLNSVLYGVYTDFEYSYEQHQGTRWDFYSSFTPEDLPSDHIGFWAAINGKGIDEIPSMLENLGQVSRRPGFGAVDPLGITKNHEFLPMVEKTVRAGRSYGFQNVNVPWPAWLEIDSIPSGPETWQRK